MRKRVPVIFLLGLLLAVAGQASKCAQPAELSIESPSGTYKAQISPGTRKESSETGLFPAARLVGPGGRPHAFSLHGPFRPDEAVVSDEGLLITFDFYCGSLKGVILSIYKPDGQVWWTFTLGDLFEGSTLEWLKSEQVGRWMAFPAEVEFAGKDESRFLLITLWNEDKLKIRLQDGKVEYSVIADFAIGHDSCRLLKRAEALEKQGEYERATKLLRSAIESDPHLAQAYSALARILKEGDQAHAALEVLETGLRKNPIEPARGECRDYSHLWLATELAQLYVETSRPREAEGIYLQSLGAEPRFWQGPGEGLVELWLKEGRYAEADLLVSFVFRSLTNSIDSVDEGEGQRELTDAIWGIGRLYEQAKRYDEVRAYYKYALEAGEYNPFLALELARILELLAMHAEALAVLDELNRWLPGKDDRGITPDIVSYEIRRIKAKQAGQPEPEWFPEMPGGDGAAN